MFLSSFSLSCCSVFIHSNLINYLFCRMIMQGKTNLSENQNQYVDGMRESRPPSTTSTFPVQYAPALLVRNKIQPAISSSVPDLSSGTLLFGKAPSPMIPAARSDGKTIQIKISKRFSCSWKFFDGRSGAAAERWTYGQEQLRSSEFHRVPNLLLIA